MRARIITPGLAAILRYLGGGGMPNRLRNMVLTEHNKHFKGLLDDRNAVIVVDISFSEINYSSADSAMSGSLALGTLWNPEKGQVIDTYLTRSKDAVSLFEPATRNILGLIFYKKIITEDESVKFRGKFIPNPFSTEVKKDLVCKVIAETLLDLLE